MARQAAGVGEEALLVVTVGEALMLMRKDSNLDQVAEKSSLAIMENIKLSFQSGFIVKSHLSKWNCRREITADNAKLILCSYCESDAGWLKDEG
jgi:hypothetical protein